MNNKTLSAGFARQDITPDYPVHLSGYGDDETRLSQGIRDNIYLTCIAVTDGDETVLVYTADTLSLANFLPERIRPLVTQATGIPGDHVFFTGTHSHSGPALYTDEEPTVRFRESLIAAAVSVAQAALADRAPAAMLSTTQEVPGMNFIRHYRMNDGTYAGSNFGNWSSGIAGHATQTDPRMVLIKFAREGARDIVMMNWQAHNDNVREVGYNLLSSSYVGHVRARFEEETGMHYAYFVGASGNQNTGSRIPEEDHGLDYIAYGRRMADHAIAALPSLTPVTGSGIRTKRVMFRYDVDHSWDHMLDTANEVYDYWKANGLQEGNKLARSYGLSSVYQSRDIRRRAVMPATGELELNAFRIGDMGFVTSTNEVFSTVGIHVRANSPFATTFILTGNHQYLPCAEAYDYRSYEADTSMFAKGTAEKIADKLVEMLHEVK
ncbi:MAG: neutral/alkaline non-lysosomal ceramidase N-terminal domain-containing protein [Oscillospiraceae bacterium]|nr:neutral/alkaline non-lysosomal ceramidase N-terminal domain-containing protein [Oscillospiraceae bacterium]